MISCGFILFLLVATKKKVHHGKREYVCNREKREDLQDLAIVRDFGGEIQGSGFCSKL